MSWPFVDRVFRLRANEYGWQLDAGDKSILYSLAHHADEDGVCFPGQRLLAEETFLSRHTVMRKLRRLEAMRVLERKGGGWTKYGRERQVIVLLLPDVRKIDPRRE